MGWTGGEEKPHHLWMASSCMILAFPYHSAKPGLVTFSLFTAFHLSDKLIALHVGRNTTTAYLWYQGDTVSISFGTSLPLFKSGWQSTTLIPVHVPTHVCVEVIFYWGEIGSRMVSSSYIHALGSVSLLG